MSENIDEIKIIDSLEKLGLKEKEAIVYIALLGLGQVGSSKIIKKTGLHGQFVYEALGHLEEVGLVVHVIQGGRKKFRANSPKRLSTLIERQHQIAEDVIKNLLAITKLPEEEQFEIYQGDDSYRNHEFELLDNAKDSAVINIIGGGVSNNKFIELMGKELGHYESMRTVRKIKVRYIGSREQEEFLKRNTQNRKFFEYKILPGDFTGLVNTNIWPDTVGFNVYGQTTLAFVIKNRNVAESYNMFFETLWNLAK